MAKKDSKKGKKGKGAPDRAEVVENVKERGKGLLEEVSAAAQRIRDSFEDVRVVDDIRAVRADLAQLTERVARLEQASSGAPARAAAGTARKATAARKRAVTPPAPKPAAGGGTATGTRSTATAAASSKDSGGTGKRPAAAKRSTTARKPAGS
jgi:hypothetical protein